MAFEALRPQAAILRLAGLALLSVSISGCQLVPRGRDRAPPPPEEQVRPEPEREEGPNLPPGETRNRIAVLVPLTGTNAAVGQSILNAANLALTDSGGQRFRITAYDTARGPLAAANQALAEGNGLFLGPLLADDARAIAPIAQRANVPVIAFSNDISIAGGGVHVMGLNPGQSIDRVIAFARSRGVQRFGALLPNNVYGERAGRALAEAVRRSGGTLSVQTYDRTAATLAAAAGRLNSQGTFEAVLIADSARNAAQAVPVLRRASPQARILGTELWTNETNVGAQAVLRGAWFAGPSNANFDALRTRYRARFNANPSRLASLGYDSVLLAVRIGENWRLGRYFPIRSLRDEDGFAGVDGAFRFGRDGIAERALEVMEVTASGARTVSPAPRDFRD